MAKPPLPAEVVAQRILAQIRAIPPGQVAGYGVVAHRAGLPGRARLVARVLGQYGQPDLPWYRVVRSDGRIAFPPGSDGHAEQTRRLQAEGVQVHKGRVRMPASRASDAASLDAWLWSPP